MPVYINRGHYNQINTYLHFPLFLSLHLLRHVGTFTYADIIFLSEHNFLVLYSGYVYEHRNKKSQMPNSCVLIINGESNLRLKITFVV